MGSGSVYQTVAQGRVQVVRNLHAMGREMSRTCFFPRPDSSRSLAPLGCNGKTSTIFRSRPFAGRTRPAYPRRRGGSAETPGGQRPQRPQGRAEARSSVDDPGCSAAADQRRRLSNHCRACRRCARAACSISLQRRRSAALAAPRPT